jgi:hypothetical protein
MELYHWAFIAAVMTIAIIFLSIRCNVWDLCKIKKLEILQPPRKDEVRVGDLFASTRVSVVFQVLESSYIVSTPEYSAVSRINILHDEDFLDTDHFSYLGNIND